MRAIVEFSFQSVVRGTLGLACPSMALVTFFLMRTWRKRAKRLRDEALAERIPFHEFSEAELRARRYAFFTAILACLGILSLVAFFWPRGDTAPSARKSEEEEAMKPEALPMTAPRDPVRSHKSTPKEQVDDNAE